MDCAHRLSFALALSVALFVGLPVAAQTRRALVIGIDSYRAMGKAGTPSAPLIGKPGAATPERQNGRHDWSDLDGCTNDARAIREVLISRYGFKPEHITFLADLHATREGILKAIRGTLIAPAKPGDVAFFYYAGHGSQVKNTASSEEDKLDESLVPADSICGVADIRDKELKILFNQVVTKGALLTAIFDSCHSGSITRGALKYRKLEMDPQDVHQPDTPDPAPEERGALIFSAAQDNQVAAEQPDPDGTPHGLLTASLLKAFKSAPPSEPAGRFFQRVKALMQAEGSTQEPVLACTPERRLRPLLGLASRGGIDDGPTVVIATVSTEQGSVTLQGGSALGLTAGSILRPLEQGKREPRLEITAVQNLANSSAKLASGKVESLKVGDVYTIEAWAPPSEPDLLVAVSKSQLTAGALASFASELKVVLEPSFTWVDDPTSQDPAYFLEFTQDEWRLYAGGKRILSLGATIPAKELASRIQAFLPRGTPPSQALIFVSLPVPGTLADRFNIGARKGRGNILEAPQGKEAHYLLAGRLRGGTMEYAWMLPNATAREVGSTALPARTAWVPVDGNSLLDSAATRLNAYLDRLARIRSWLVLSPPSSGERPFPYHLAYKNKTTAAILDPTAASGPLLAHKGQGFTPVLMATQEDLARAGLGIRPRFVYVFVIDCEGTSQLVFPSTTQGNVENRLPRADADGEYPAVIELKRSFTVSEPFGTDHWFLLTSEDPVPDPTVFNSEGVSRGEGGPRNPLTWLLESRTFGTRGTTLSAVPATWSLERTAIRSVP